MLVHLFLRISVWQIRSLCTDVYHDARSHLNQCFPIIDEMERDGRDAMTQYLRDHTQKMLDQLDVEDIWRTQWGVTGEVAPTEAEHLEQEVRGLEMRDGEEEEIQRLLEGLAVSDRAEACKGDEMGTDSAQANSKTTER